MIELPFYDVENYSLPIGGCDYRFTTMVSNDGIVCWSPKNGQRTVHVHHRGDFSDGNRIELGEVHQENIADMLGRIISIKTKTTPSREDVLRDHSDLVATILADFREYKAKHDERVA